MALRFWGMLSKPLSKHIEHVSLATLSNDLTGVETDGVILEPFSINGPGLSTSKFSMHVSDVGPFVSHFYNALMASCDRGVLLWAQVMAQRIRFRSHFECRCCKGWLDQMCPDDFRTQ